MNILILENREKTQFWNAVFSDKKFNHFDISWIVQNPVFNRKLVGSVYKIDFPSKRDFCPPSEKQNLLTDRGRDFFKSGDQHYAYYYRKIDEIIKIFRRNAVFQKLIFI